MVFPSRTQEVPRILRTAPRERECGVRAASPKWWKCKSRRLKEATLLILTRCSRPPIKIWPMISLSTWLITSKHLTYIIKFMIKWLRKRDSKDSFRETEVGLNVIKMKNSMRALAASRKLVIKVQRESDIWRGTTHNLKKRSWKRYKKEFLTWYWALNQGSKRALNNWIKSQLARNRLKQALVNLTRMPLQVRIFNLVSIHLKYWIRS